ncbi:MULTISPECIES: hypothetical protein [Serratia]|uniref:hypothetical protein n=1 Tax=Serratia TaxID=613 RepID=UPI0013053BD8|nr:MULTISPECIES: hypothetical protein [Serratia]
MKYTYIRSYYSLNINLIANICCFGTTPPWAVTEDILAASAARPGDCVNLMATQSSAAQPSKRLLSPQKDGDIQNGAC